MKVLSSVVAIGLTLTSLSARAQAPIWNIDPNHTAAQFAVKHLLVSTVRGQFDRLSGTVQWDGNDVKTMVVNVSIDAASINTRIQARDNDLRSTNFFDVGTYPTITFASKSVQPVDATHFKMTGALTMHGVTKDVVLDVEGPSAPLSSPQGLRVGASASTKVDRHDWGLHYNRAIEAAPIVGDLITITLDIEATRRP